MNLESNGEHRRRERMETDEAKQLYRGRAGLVELANAHQKTHHGITQVKPRGSCSTRRRTSGSSNET